MHSNNSSSSSSSQLLSQSPYNSRSTQQQHCSLQAPLTTSSRTVLQPRQISQLQDLPVLAPLHLKGIQAHHMQLPWNQDRALQSLVQQQGWSRGQSRAQTSLREVGLLLVLAYPARSCLWR